MICIHWDNSPGVYKSNWIAKTKQHNKIHRFMHVCLHFCLTWIKLFWENAMFDISWLMNTYTCACVAIVFVSIWYLSMNWILVRMPLRNLNYPNSYIANGPIKRYEIHSSVCNWDYNTHKWTAHDVSFTQVALKHRYNFIRWIKNLCCSHIQLSVQHSHKHTHKHSRTQSNLTSNINERRKKNWTNSHTYSDMKMCANSHTCQTNVNICGAK